MKLAGKYNSQVNNSSSVNSVANQYLAVLSNPNTSEQQKMQAMVALSELMNKQ